MSRKRKDRCAPLRSIDEPFIPKPGPGQFFVRGDQREVAWKLKNVGDPLDMALQREQITPELFAAGNTFRVLFGKLARSGRDSTQALNRVNSSVQGDVWADTACDAGESLAKIKSRMPGRDYRIVQKFCGEAVDAAEAVQRVTPCHPSGIRYRIVEALEALDDALESLRLRRVV